MRHEAEVDGNGSLVGERSIFCQEMEMRWRHYGGT